jgi:ceramide glucosyltransferase
MHYLIFILIIPIIAAVMLRIWTHRLTWQFFSRPTHLPSAGCEPVSILVPVRGLDQQAEANYRSYCEQEYGATHEVIFALEEEDDPAAAVIEALAASYPPESVRAHHQPRRRRYRQDQESDRSRTSMSTRSLDTGGF